jgi:hypothetical protein
MELITAPKKEQVFSKRPENRIKGTSEELPLSPLIQLLLSGRLMGVTSTSLVGAGREVGVKQNGCFSMNPSPSPSSCFSTSLLSLPKIKQKKRQPMLSLHQGSWGWILVLLLGKKSGSGAE